jgi:hypothetical protein
MSVLIIIRSIAQLGGSEERVVRFAALTYRIAGIWGLIVITPMYFLYGVIGRQDPPPLSHPHFYFGWLGVTLAWQILFLVLSTDPVRYRPMMIPAVLEKLGFVLATVVLLWLGMIQPKHAAAAVPDAILMVFFIAAFVKTPGTYFSQR